jgi:PKD domain
MKTHNYLLIALAAASASALSIPTASAAPLSGDVVVNLANPKSMVELSIGGTPPTELAVLQASLSMATQNAGCFAQGCTFSINHLVVSFQDFGVDVLVNGNDATFTAMNPVVIIEGPLIVSQNGSAIVVPVGTPTTVSAFVSGGTSGQEITPGTRTNVTTLPSPLLIQLDVQDQLATIDGNIDFTIPVDNVSIAGTAGILGANLGPFVNLPPVPSAGAAQTLVCPGFATVNASATTDPENNIVNYTWTTGSGAFASGAPAAQFFFGSGVTPATVTVTDLYSSQRTATTTVTVLNGPPTGNSDCASCVTNAGCASFVCTGGICLPPACSPTCQVGAPCGANRDCGSGVCTNGTCQPPACSPKCVQGATCSDNSNCESFVCQNNVCAAPSCSPACNQGAPCGANHDCGSQVCTNGTCRAPACTPTCATGSPCNNNGDCASFLCVGNVCQAGGSSSGGGAPPACSPSCTDGSACNNNNQCASFVCAAGVCKLPSCSPTCNQGAPCGANGDCGSAVCTGGLCAPPACSPKCASGSHCNNNHDCSSSSCVNARCQ